MPIEPCNEKALFVAYLLSHDFQCEGRRKELATHPYNTKLFCKGFQQCNGSQT